MDVNCDLGESFGNWRLGADDELLPRISTASVACGFHGGDPLTMQATVELAAAHDVAVGAHPGLPDLLGFGRRVMNVTPEDLHAYITYQAGALAAFLAPQDRALSHVKPHGALYPMLNERQDLAEATVRAMCELMDQPVLYWPAGSDDRALVRTARAAGVAVVGEFYPDSRYGADGETVLERHREPVDPAGAEAALRRFLADGTVVAIDGTVLELAAESICIHGDGPTAVAMVDRVRSVLDELGYALRTAAATAEVGSG